MQPPISRWPKSRAKTKAMPPLPRTLAVSSSIPPLSQPLEDAGTSDAVAGEAVPVVDNPLVEAELSNPFTSFDELQGTRVLMGSVDWPNYLYINHALETSDLPGTPEGRVMVSELASFPSPQIAITQDRGPEHRCTVVVDAGLIGGAVETLDIFPGVTPVGVIRGLRSVLYPRAAEDHLRLGQLLCLVNQRVVDYHATVPADADVMQFMAVRVPVASSATDLAAPCTVEPKACIPVIRYQGPRPATPSVPGGACRPPTPSGSASQQVIRRYRPEHVTARPFASFDAHYGHRTFYIHGFASYPERLQLVLQASPDLGLSPRYQWLDHEVEGLPVPQLVLQQAHVPSQYWTYPFDLRPCGGHVCVLIAARRCSTLEFLARASDVCRLHARMTALVSDGSFSLEVDGHLVSPTASDVLKFGSTARLRPRGRWGRHQVFRRHGAVAGMLPDRHSPDHSPRASSSSSGVRSRLPASLFEYYPLDGDRFCAHEDVEVFVHVAGIQPVVLQVPFMANVGDICQLAMSAVAPLLPEVASMRCRWRPCPTTPVGEHLLHSVLIVGEPESVSECHVILDLRASGVAGPAYHTAVFPAVLSTELLFSLITNFLGGHRPRAIFHGIAPVADYMCALTNGDMLRPVCSSTATQIQVTQAPALWRTTSCMAVLPGLRMALLSARNAPQTQGLWSEDENDATTTTTTAVFYGTTATTTSVGHTECVPFQPFVGLHQLAFEVHLMGPDAAVAHTCQPGRGHVAEVLTELLWCLCERTAFPAGCTVVACPRVFFDGSGKAHFFISARSPGRGRFFRLFAPDCERRPRCIPWHDQLEIPDVLDNLGILIDGPLTISINGEVCREHPVLAAPGSVIRVSRAVSTHFTLPLNAMRHRCAGVQSLHFRARGPGAVHMVSRAALRQYCHGIVAHARGLLGENLRGNQFLIAGMRAPPLICCAGTPLPPTLSQAQSFYDACLQPHFGAMHLKDTASVQYDVTIFVQRQDSAQRRIWVLPMEHAMDSLYGDVDGFCLASLPTPPGFGIEPSVRSSWLGVARLQPCHAAQAPVVVDLVRTPPGLSSSSSSFDYDDHMARPSRPLSAHEEVVLARWTHRNQRLRHQQRRVLDVGLDSDVELMPVDQPPQSLSSSDSDVEEIPAPVEDAADGTDDQCLLQHSVRVGGAFRTTLNGGAPLPDHSPCEVQVVTNSGILALHISVSHTFEDISRQLLQAGRSESAQDLVPLYPAAPKGPSLLLRARVPGWVTLAIRYGHHAGISLACVPANVDGQRVMALCGHADLTFAGQHISHVTSFFDGMLLEAATAPDAQNGPTLVRCAGAASLGQASSPDGPAIAASSARFPALVCRFSLAAAIEADGNSLACLGAACAMLTLLSQDHVFTLSSSRTCVRLTSQVARAVDTCADGLSLQDLYPGVQAHLYTRPDGVSCVTSAPLPTGGIIKDALEPHRMLASLVSGDMTAVRPKPVPLQRPLFGHFACLHGFHSIYATTVRGQHSQPWVSGLFPWSPMVLCAKATVSLGFCFSFMKPGAVVLLSTMFIRIPDAIGMIMLIWLQVRRRMNFCLKFCCPLNGIMFSKVLCLGGCGCCQLDRVRQGSPMWQLF